MNETGKSEWVTGLGVTGLVIGILTFVVSIIPCFGFFAIYLGIIGILISTAGLIVAFKTKSGKGLLIAAIILSILGSYFAVSWIIGLDSLGS